MLRNSVMLLAAVALVAGLTTSAGAHNGDAFDIPSLPSDISAGVAVDGDLSDWKDFAFTEGHWTYSRMSESGRPWFNTNCTTLVTDPDTGPEGTPGTDDDLGGTFYQAWDDNYLYFGLEATDNAVDNTSRGDDYLGAWNRETFGLFIDALHDGDTNAYIRGDYNWWFTAWDTEDTRPMPHRHGEGETENVWTELSPSDEEMWAHARPPTDSSADNFDDTYGANWTMEVRLAHASAFKFSPEVLPIEGKTMGMGLLVTSSDGEGFGDEQLCAYIGSDDDGSWGDFTFVRTDEGPPVSVETASWRTIKAMFK